MKKNTEQKITLNKAEIAAIETVGKQLRQHEEQRNYLRAQLQQVNDQINQKAQISDNILAMCCANKEIAFDLEKKEISYTGGIITIKDKA